MGNTLLPEDVGGSHLSYIVSLRLARATLDPASIKQAVKYLPTVIDPERFSHKKPRSTWLQPIYHGFVLISEDICIMVLHVSEAYT